MRTIAIVAAALALCGAPACAASALDGAWEITVSAPQGVFPATLTFAEADGGYTVEVDEGGAFGPPQISDLTVEGDSFSFTRMLDFGEGPQPFVYSGTAEGDVISGKVESSVGPMTITGARKQGDATQ